MGQFTSWVASVAKFAASPDTKNTMMPVFSYIYFIFAAAITIFITLFRIRDAYTTHSTYFPPVTPRITRSEILPIDNQCLPTIPPITTAQYPHASHTFPPWSARAISKSTPPRYGQQTIPNILSTPDSQLALNHTTTPAKRPRDIATPKRGQCHIWP